MVLSWSPWKALWAMVPLFTFSLEDFCLQRKKPIAAQAKDTISTLNMPKNSFKEQDVMVAMMDKKKRGGGKMPRYVNVSVTGS